MRKQGFTLIELSIVLVIIGLIVGGVLVGRDLVAAAEVRAQVSQIEKLQAATKTFYGKYGYLPGDLPTGPATQFNFTARGGYAGQGDGNGILEGFLTNAPTSDEGMRQGGGETALFWRDLSTDHMIDGSFPYANATTDHLMYLGNSNPAYLPSNYFPTAKLGSGNLIFAYSNGGGYTSNMSGVNYFDLATFSAIDGAGAIDTVPGVTVQQAYKIDTKIDDGLPQAGNVTAKFIAYGKAYGQDSWAAGGGSIGAAPGVATAASTTTCYDNNNNTANTMAYSIAQNNGAGVNCALSFRIK